MSDILAPGYVALAYCAVALGFLLCFFGLRFARVSLFTVAFLGGGALTVLLTSLSFLDLSPTSAVPSMNWTAFTSGGFLCGCLASTFARLGVFITGFCSGFTLLVLVLSVTGFSSSSKVLLLLVVALGVGGGVLAFKHEKLALMAASSLMGATLMASAIGFLVWRAVIVGASDGDSIKEMLDVLQLAIWVLYAALLILVWLGMLVQRKITGRESYYGSSSRPTVENERQLEDGRGGFANLLTPKAERFQCVENSGAGYQVTVRQ